MTRRRAWDQPSAPVLHSQGALRTSMARFMRGDGACGRLSYLAPAGIQAVAWLGVITSCDGGVLSI